MMIVCPMMSALKFHSSVIKVVNMKAPLDNDVSKDGIIKLSAHQRLIISHHKAWVFIFTTANKRKKKRKEIIFL